MTILEQLIKAIIKRVCKKTQKTSTPVFQAYSFNVTACLWKDVLHFPSYQGLGTDRLHLCSLIYCSSICAHRISGKCSGRVFGFLFFRLSINLYFLGLLVKNFLLAVPQKEGFSGCFQFYEVEHGFLASCWLVCFCVCVCVSFGGFLLYWGFFPPWVSFGHEGI